MIRRQSSPRARSFIFRGGTRIAETVIACDGQGGGELLFLSSARARERATSRHVAAGSRRAQVLLTSETLALLGPEGERLRSRALVVGLGRPFTLGSLRLELLPSGHMPGAAALSCEFGDRRVLYAGAARLGTPAKGAIPGAVRAAEAVCVDATFGHPRFVFISREEAEAAVCSFARSARDGGYAPIVLAATFGPAQEIAAALAADGWRLRGHRSTVAAMAAYRSAGVETPPVARFSGALGVDEVLLWPPSNRNAGLLARLGRTQVAWVSGWAADPSAVAELRVERAIPYSSYPDFAALLAYVAASGAREVATVRGFSEAFAATLRERDLDAYSLGPPRQIALFRDEV